MDTSPPDDDSAEAAAMRELGAELTAEREAAGLSQSEAARRSRIGRATLIRWEKGEGPARPDLLARLRALYRGDTVALPHEAEADTIAVSRETLGYLRGKLETTVEWLGSVEAQMGALGASVHAVGETLQALRHQLDRATLGVSGLLSGDVLPIGDYRPPTPPGRPSRSETIQAAAAAGIRPVEPPSSAAAGD